MQTPPKLTAEQRQLASVRAVANRRRRAEVKDQLRAGEMTWEQVLALAETDDVVAALRVSDVLLAIPGVGPMRVKRFMKYAHVSQTRRLRGLGPQQVRLLSRVLSW